MLPQVAVNSPIIEASPEIQTAPDSDLWHQYQCSVFVGRCPAQPSPAQPSPAPLTNILHFSIAVSHGALWDCSRTFCWMVAPS